MTGGDTHHYTNWEVGRFVVMKPFSFLSKQMKPTGGFSVIFFVNCILFCISVKFFYIISDCFALYLIEIYAHLLVYYPFSSSIYGSLSMVRCSVGVVAA